MYPQFLGKCKKQQTIRKILKIGTCFLIMGGVYKHDQSPGATDPGVRLEALSFNPGPTRVQPGVRLGDLSLEGIDSNSDGDTCVGYPFQFSSGNGTSGLTSVDSRVRLRSNPGLDSSNLSRSN